MLVLRSHAAPLARVLLTIVASAAIFFTAYNGIHTGGLLEVLAIAAMVLLWLALLWRFGAAISRFLERSAAASLRLSAGTWIAGCIAIGLALRIILPLLFPSQPESDALYYLGLGKQLAFEGRYLSREGWVAFWPPGLPLALAAIFLVVGDHDWVPLLLSSLAYVTSVAIVFGTAHRLFGETAARIASALIALWPSSILMSSFATKELLLIPLITGALLAYIKARRDSALLFAGVAGYLTGAAALVQPAVILFPAVFAVDEMLGARRLKPALQRLALCGLLMIVAITPWTIRNYVVLHKFVPISTNGGVSLYHGNNPQATGQWVPAPLGQFGRDEISHDREARKAALAWIAGNPARFVQISARRFGYFLSGDDVGAGWFFARGRGETGLAYETLCVAGNLFWVAVFSMIFVALIARSPAFPDRARGDVALILGFFYGLLVDTIVEGHANRHIAFYGVLAVLASAIVLRSAPASAPRVERMAAPPAASGRDPRGQSHFAQQLFDAPVGNDPEHRDEREERER